jgi:hypothetical protein
MAEIKTIGNKYPCCQKPTGLHHDEHDDEAVLERKCPKCDTGWIITFESVELSGLPGRRFRKLNWERKTPARNKHERDGVSRSDAEASSV